VHLTRKRKIRIFQTDDEIRLVLTQTERAVSEYKPLLVKEENKMGKEGREAAARDMEVVRGPETALAGFRKNPQAFNGPLGFAFFEWIDDARHNALLSSVSASGLLTVSLIDGNKEKALTYADLSKDFANVSTVFYTLSENAGALFARYVSGEEDLAKLGLKVATDRTNALKKKGDTASKQ
jgi:hypothetical protein